MNIVKSGRYSFDFNAAGAKFSAIQIFTLKPDSTRSRFLNAQEALDLLHYLQSHEQELTAMVAQEKAASQPVQAPLMEVEVSAETGTAIVP